ncbi:MAG TPA: peptidylprolyl isomerase [Candidatus Krumholzibacteria bacterium]|nr:peptidylprolyl isomerase [Candidatus Krumholzibacteria bacterium]
MRYRIFFLAMLALSCAGAVAMAQTQAGPDSTATKTPAPSPPASAPAPATQSPSPTTPSTSGEIIDRIVAVVEDEAIFESDVDQAVRQYFFQKGQSSVTPAERDEVFDDALQNLINDKLVIAQAGRLGIDVPFSDVEAQVKKAVDENTKQLGGEEAFSRQLQQEGLTLDELKKLYRTQIRNRMLVERVLQKDMQKEHKDPTPEELRKFYDENKQRLPLRPEVAHLKTIFIGFDTSTGSTADAKKKIDALRARIMGGEKFEDVAKAESDDPSGSLGGDLGFVKPEDLREPNFAKAASTLAIGQLSDPVLTVYGYHLIEVTDKRPESGEVRLRHILVRAEPTDKDVEEVFATANKVHADLVAGASFDSLAARYNTDPAADKTGDLGWLRVSELPEFFRDVLSNLKPGDISQVTRESTGFRIVQLLARDAERPYEFSEIQSELKQYYSQQSFGSSYEEYVKELRKKFSVEMRN